MSNEITADGIKTAGTQTQSPAPSIWQGNDTERLLQENRGRNPVGSDPLKKPEVQEFIDMSPTLKNDIEKLKAEKWNFEFTNRGYSSINESKKIVYLRNNVNEAGTGSDLAHEVGHALKTVPFDYTDKKAYVDSRLEDEGAATMKNLQVRDEILANSKGKKEIAVNCGEPPCDTRYKKIWDKYLADGDADSARKEIGELKRHELMGDGRETYEQYYGRGWDEKQQKFQELNQQKLQGNSPASQVPAPAASNQTDTPPQPQPAPSNESQADIRVLSNANTEEWRRQADAFRQLPPEKAVEQHPELAPAYGSMRAVESKVEADGLTEQQRNIVMDRTRENIAGQIERGKIPDMQVREESQTQAVQQAEMSR